MSTALKLRRGTTAQHSTFTGLEAELTVDTTKDTAVVHNGTTAGGFPLLRQDLANNTDVAKLSVLSTVATTGAYSDLTGKPTLGTAAATDSTAYATATQGTQGATAYGWGDHALAGYVTSADPAGTAVALAIALG
jgi:hypothetical protein